MKKMILLVMVCLLALSLSALSFAATPTYTNGQIAAWENEAYRTTQEVHAVVEPYANASFSGVPYLEFEGWANEFRSAATILSIVRNADINITVNGSTLTQVADINGAGVGDTIPTSYAVSKTSTLVFPASANAGQDITGTSLSGKGTSNVYVGVAGKLGAIDAQSAGSYKSLITVTITSPLKKPAYDID